MLLARSARVRALLLSLVGASSGLIYAQNGRLGATYISGTWSDACPCNIPCPCWKRHESSARMCVKFHVFRIRNGSYDGVDLSGSVFVLMNSPKGLRQAPVADTLFVDTDDARKAAAIENSLKRLFAFTPPKVLRTSIQYYESGKKQRVSIPGLLSYNVSFERERRLSDDVSENLYNWLSNARQGSVESVVYSSAVGEIVKYANTNAISAEFRILVPQP